MLYFDITNFCSTRATTGIQRVSREILTRAVCDETISDKTAALNFDAESEKFNLIEINSLRSFLLNPKHAKLAYSKSMELTDFEKGDIFFDIDSVWNLPLKRAFLYPFLKKNEVVIYTYVYDLSPILLPAYAHPNTLRNFLTYLWAVYTFSDLVLTCSRSTERDFEQVSNKIGNQRQVPTVVTKLGCDFDISSAENLESEIDLADDLRHALTQRYLLFIGTIEPRKRHDLMLESFDLLSDQHSELCLVFVGKKGWLVDEFVQKILSHKHYGVRIFWFENISDEILKKFYENAFLSVYLSNYEGFGLPIGESLSCGVPTITSLNSSIYEVGKDFADYVRFNSVIELAEIIDSYCTHDDLYRLKRRHIREQFRPYTWASVYELIAKVIKNHNKSMALRRTDRQKRQLVIISIRPENARLCIESIEKNFWPVKEFIIITNEIYLAAFKEINSKHTIIVVNEKELLGEEYSRFTQSNHQEKNWLLRSRVVNIEFLDEEFLMLDDDNHVVTRIDSSFFKSPEGRYKAFYYNELLRWHHFESDYDFGQHTTRMVLDEKNLETLSYSSHCPQIINKSLLRESIIEFSKTKSSLNLDEWSSYFNYSITRYPALFVKTPHATLNWPASPSDWRTQFDPKEFVFENYYENMYSIGLFRGLHPSDSLAEKASRKSAELAPFLVTEKFNSTMSKDIGSRDMLHGVMKFEHEDVKIFLGSIPYILFGARQSVIRLELNFKIIGTNSNRDDIRVVIFRSEGLFSQAKLNSNLSAASAYDEGIVSVPISIGLKSKTGNIYVLMERNGKMLDSNNQEYISRLFVIEEGQSVSDKIDMTS